MRKRTARIVRDGLMIVEVEELGRAPRRWLRIKRIFAFSEQCGLTNMHGFGR